MILSGGNRSTGRKICPTATLSTTNLTLPGLGTKMCLQDDSRNTDLLTHRTATMRSEVRLNTAKRRITAFRLTTDRIYDGGAIRFQYNIIL